MFPQRLQEEEEEGEEEEEEEEEEEKEVSELLNLLFLILVSLSWLKKKSGSFIKQPLSVVTYQVKPHGMAWQK